MDLPAAFIVTWRATAGGIRRNAPIGQYHSVARHAHETSLAAPMEVVDADVTVLVTAAVCDTTEVVFLV
jgi:hypothetical protein